MTAKGGVLRSDKVQGTIGGNVNVESLQDTYAYKNKQKDVGVGLDIDLVNSGAGSSISVNGNKSNATADYAAINEKSAIIAGDGGYQFFLTRIHLSPHN